MLLETRRVRPGQETDPKKIAATTSIISVASATDAAAVVA